MMVVNMQGKSGVLQAGGKWAYPYRGACINNYKLIHSCKIDIFDFLEIIAVEKRLRNEVAKALSWDPAKARRASG